MLYEVITTHELRWFTKSEAIDLLKNNDVDRLGKPGKVEDGVEYWSNKQVFSRILPSDLNMVFQASSCKNCEKCMKTECDRDAYVQIRDGELVSGSYNFV